MLLLSPIHTNPRLVDNDCLASAWRHLPFFGRGVSQSKKAAGYIQKTDWPSFNSEVKQWRS